MGEDSRISGVSRAERGIRQGEPAGAGIGKGPEVRAAVADPAGEGWEVLEDIPCVRCGECCTRYQVRITLAEAGWIANELGMGLEEFLLDYADQRWAGAQSFVLRHRDGACMFLARDDHQPFRSRCLVHGFKPISCQMWRPTVYRRECRAGLAKYWGITVSPEGKIEGSPEAVEAFNGYVRMMHGTGSITGGTNAGL